MKRRVNAVDDLECGGSEERIVYGDTRGLDIPEQISVVRNETSKLS